MNNTLSMFDRLPAEIELLIYKKYSDGNVLPELTGLNNKLKCTFRCEVLPQVVLLSILEKVGKIVNTLIPDGTSAETINDPVNICRLDEMYCTILKTHLEGNYDIYNI